MGGGWGGGGCGVSLQTPLRDQSWFQRLLPGLFGVSQNPGRDFGRRCPPVAIIRLQSEWRSACPTGAASLQRPPNVPLTEPLGGYRWAGGGAPRPRWLPPALSEPLSAPPHPQGPRGTSAPRSPACACGTAASRPSSGSSPSRCPAGELGTPPGIFFFPPLPHNPHGGGWSRPRSHLFSSFCAPAAAP